MQALLESLGCCHRRDREDSLDEADCGAGPKRRARLTFRVLLLGQTSDGKSTLVNNFAGREVSVARKSAQGTTKEVLGTPVATGSWGAAGVALVLFDCPGYGDADVSQAALVEKIREAEASAKEPFDAALIMAKTTDGSLTQASKAVAEMIGATFMGHSRWSSVVFVGTQDDKCDDEEEKRVFVTEKLELLNSFVGSDIREACTINCAPMDRLTHSPGLDRLRSILGAMMQKKASGLWNGLGAMRQPAEVQRRLSISMAKQAGTISPLASKAKVNWDPQFIPCDSSSSGDDDDEPPMAPEETDSEDGADGAAADRRGLAAVREVFAKSPEHGTELVLDWVRCLHPHWDEVEEDTVTGKQVKWVRTRNDWVYGELSQDSFLELMHHVEPQPGEVFVDLGSGTGKVSALASLHFERVVGLELQADLHKHSEALANKFRARLEAKGVQAGDIQLCRSDFLGALTEAWQEAGRGWWEVADVAYACCPKFCQETMAGLNKRAASMRPGSRFVTVRNELTGPELEEVWRGRADFSWGCDDLIIYRRRANVEGGESQ